MLRRARPPLARGNRYGDHFVVRKGVSALLMDAADIAVVGEAGDGREAVEAAGFRVTR